MRNVIPSIQLGGQTRRATVLCTDLKGFGRLSRDWSATAAMDFLNRCFTRLGDCVERCHGQIDKFIGDAMLVHFNTTRRQPDHALRAVRCAWDMLQALRTWDDADAEHVQIGIGVATGTVAFGNLGTPTYNELTVIGVAVNEAALLSGRARGGDLLITQATKDAAGDPVRAEQQEKWWRVTDVAARTD